jgi:phosphopantetheine--protein transferase-like protein
MKSSEIVGIGIDLMEIAEIQDRYKKDPGIIDEILSEKEKGRLSNSKHFFRDFALFFTIKEAVIKAIIDDDLTGFIWKNIEINLLRVGAVQIELSGRLKELFDSKQLGEITISYTYTNEYSIAFAMIRRLRLTSDISHLASDNYHQNIGT